MTLTQILKTLVTIILVISFLLVTVSAYQQHRRISALAELSDATTAIVTRLSVEELAYVDNDGNLHMYTIDPAKLEGLSTRREFGGENFDFQVSVRYEAGGERVLGPFGSTPPEDRTRGSLAVPCVIYENAHFLPAKLSVMAWRA
ncbi:MAG: hypothetical protein CEE41_02830 [Hadesarchaea archaeon B3_Hades]|nr:MAG: hypothetical protein CEE41_02830 [Hadesarchaea archaeon B3_Hades]